MLIWRGRGILVLLIAAPLGGLGAFTAMTLIGEGADPMGAGIGLLPAAVAVFFLGRKLNAPRQGFHPATGQPVLHRNAHTFFFVPMQYWAFILPVPAVAFIVTGLSALA
ncbi:hypothetical protein KIK06_20390 [Nocardiopsis sp. EMB25]|uniref:hypothetical protein n=1 Tax=Nocardiopsis sp. EMB25 TaxID=2835867 RepID=UPI0022852DEF|nr:hypothetical protein [Nocardiopsis sp. EMB25]MCY9786257.1 hypothetical protein [Nocardiopsis sp. EMB25]